MLTSAFAIAAHHRPLPAIVTGPPTPSQSPAAFIGFGDSRVQKSSGFTGSGSSFGTTIGVAGGFMGGILSALGGKSLPGRYGMYGAGATTTRAGTKRISVVSNASTGNTAQTDTGNASDAQFSPQSTGEYSAVTDPAQIVWYLYSTNDPGYASYFTTPKASMLEIASHLDSFNAAGKFVFLLNELPRGRSIIYGDVRTVTALACTLTYGGTTSNSPAVTRLINKDTGAVYTDVGAGSLTATGQFKVTSTTTTTTVSFFTGDTIATSQIDYYVTGSTTSTYLNTVHNWLSSSASNFIDPDSGTDYAIPGALYGRSAYVELVDVWAAAKDPATSYPNVKAIDGFYAGDNLGLHPSALGTFLVGAACKAAFDRRFSSAPVLDKLPGKNAVLFATANGVLTSFSGTLPTVGMVPVTLGQLAIYVAGVLAGIDNGSGAITPQGANLASGTINYATGALALTFSAAPANNAKIEVYADSGTNLVVNGLLDPAQGTGGTLPTSNGGKAANTAGATVTGSLPKGWSVQVDTDTQTALTAGTFALDFDATQTHPVTGLPELRVSVLGAIGGTLNTASQITITTTVTVPASRIPTNKTVRSGAVMRVLEKNGVLQGFLGPECDCQLQTSPGVTRPATNNGTQTATILRNYGLKPGSGTPYTSDMLPVNLRSTTAAVSAAGTTLTTATLQLVVNIERGHWISGVACFSQAGMWLE